MKAATLVLVFALALFAPLGDPPQSASLDAIVLMQATATLLVLNRIVNQRANGNIALCQMPHSRCSVAVVPLTGPPS